MNYHTVTDRRDEYIWSLLLSHAGETFSTARGLPFTYHQKISRTGEPLGELVIDRKEKTITKSTILMVFHKAVVLQKQQGYISGPKQIGGFGASYLYPMFLRFGIIRQTPIV